MSPNELDAVIARKADTPTLKLSVAGVSRVRSCLFIELSKLPPADMAETIARCLRSAEAYLNDEAMG